MAPVFIEKLPRKLIQPVKFMDVYGDVVIEKHYRR